MFLNMADLNVLSIAMLNQQKYYFLSKHQIKWQEHVLNGRNQEQKPYQIWNICRYSPNIKILDLYFTQTLEIKLFIY